MAYKEPSFSIPCAFSAYLATSDDDVTGNNTTYSIGFNVPLTELFDVDDCFDPGVAGVSPATFTAPYALNMYFELGTTIGDITTATAYTAGILVDGVLYGCFSVNPTNAHNLGSGECGFQGTAIVPMLAGDIATFVVQVNGNGADTIDLDVIARRTRVAGFCVNRL